MVSFYSDSLSFLFIYLLISGIYESSSDEDDLEEKWDDDKYRAEYDVDRAEGWADRKFDDGVQDVEDFPEDAARWTGNKVQEVEDIPEDIAQDVGDGVGDVERFGDNVADAYDDGRDDRRYDDDNRW